MSTAVWRLPVPANVWMQVRAAPLWTWALAAVVAFVGINLMSGLPDLAQQLGDTDDATRLTEVREFLAGAPWFDTTLPRFGGPEPLVSHWSRLVDLPLGTLIAIFSLAMSEAEAELMVRAIWPVLLLMPMLYVLAAAAEERAGRFAAFVALTLTVLSFAALVQFPPGRIDHHNLQNLAAIAGILLLAGAFRASSRGIPAGIVLALGLSVGIEALPVSGAALGVAALLAVWTGDGREGLELAAIAFAATLAAAFVATISPANWFEVRCDALSLNLVMMAVVAAIGFVALLRLGMEQPRAVRISALAAVGVAAISAYLAVKPVCIGGPFAEVDPAVYPIWLSKVSETRSFLWLLANTQATAIACGLQVLAGVGAALLILRRERDNGALLYTAVLVLTALICVVQVKLMAYASLLAILPLAVVISRIPGSAEVSAETLRFGALTLANQKTLLLAGALIAGFDNPATAEFSAQREGKKACLTADAMQPLASLPAGLAVAEIDLGPYLVATTRLSALAAPYHRIDRSILAAHTILSGSADDAELRLRDVGASYIVLCENSAQSRKGDSRSAEASLKSALLAGAQPVFLKRVTLPAPTPLQVWRIVGR